MKPGHWLFAGLVVGLCLMAAAAQYITKRGAPAVTAQRELAEERIPQIEAQSKATRRATRARIDHEVDDASRSRDLVDYFNSRSTK